VAFSITTNQDDTIVITLAHEGAHIQQKGSEGSFCRPDTEEEAESGGTETFGRLEV
jgi:hypothetical protein